MPHPFNLKDPVHLAAVGFGSGLAAKAPGTFGTIAAIPFYCVFAVLPLSAFITLCLVTSIAGIFICDKTSKDIKVHDHGSIVWDEFAGFWITMIPAVYLQQGLSIAWIIIGFALFRLFDIWKPFPIRLLDRHVHGGFGIMVDDVLAGIFAAACLYGVIIKLPNLPYLIESF